MYQSTATIFSNYRSNNWIRKEQLKEIKISHWSRYCKCRNCEKVCKESQLFFAAFQSSNSWSRRWLQLIIKAKNWCFHVLKCEILLQSEWVFLFFSFLFADCAKNENTHQMQNHFEALHDQEKKLSVILCWTMFSFDDNTSASWHRFKKPQSSIA